MKRFLSTTSLLILGTWFPTHAQHRPRPPLDSLEQRVHQLEQIVREHEWRLTQLEERRREPPLRPNIPISCLLIDTGFSRSFLGKGRTRLEADTSAREECSKAVHTSYCRAETRCSSGAPERGARGYYCVVRDTGFGRVFSGEASDEIEAEFKARQGCQSAVHPPYCARAQASCEPIR